MKRINEKLFAALLCMMLGFAIGGCADDKESASVPVTDKVTESVTVTEAAVTEATVTEAAVVTEAPSVTKTDKERVKVENLQRFEISSSSIEGEEWKRITGGNNGNKSPEILWDEVEGASLYAVLMIDKDARNWLHWYVTVDKPNVTEGEFDSLEKGYIGPYPPKTHEYEVYVVALKAEAPNGNFMLDATGKGINSKLTLLDTAADGSTGNVLAYGMISAKYSP